MPALFPSGDWRTRAACRDVDPEIFFPSGDPGDPFDVRNAEALDVCARCPVVAECLALALQRLPYGIAGGMTADERRIVRHERAVRAAARTAPVRGRAGRSAPRVAAGPDTDLDASRAGVRARGVKLLRAGAPRRKVAEQLDVSLRTVERWITHYAITTPAVPATSVLTGSAGRGRAGTSGIRPGAGARRVA